MPDVEKCNNACGDFHEFVRFSNRVCFVDFICIRFASVRFGRASRRKSGFHLGKSASEPNLTGDCVCGAVLQAGPTKMQIDFFSFQIISRRDSRTIWRSCCTSMWPSMNWNSIENVVHHMRKTKSTAISVCTIKPLSRHHFRHWKLNTKKSLENRTCAVVRCRRPSAIWRRPRKSSSKHCAMMTPM